MTSVNVKIEVIVLDNNDEKPHMCEVSLNTLTRHERASVGVNCAAHRQNRSGRRAP
jgi:hypothetical protein